ncbi:hypothetical protein OXPF_39580 [Oxobacter pfennigii]|uniref:DUF1540 domain-containing protein n=1 Tax=Oxobacter pfennigii TaxID=36849 RepID=A0A0P8W3L8_9CLOT|nr:hypothetical protein [Oxobacter pfennigii]KPU42179.1 hypothetical protein OXPF_39580 [Oxobacter pfennigii]
MKVKCDIDVCKYYKEGECVTEELKINEEGECDCFEYPDKFFKHIKNPAGKYEWIEAMGKKTEVLGREMFVCYGYITDGRTGAVLCDADFKEKAESKKEEILKKAAELEEKYGISPLYQA